MNPNQRHPEETQKQYKERLRQQKIAAKGGNTKMLWPAYKGTYIRVKHGPLVA